MIGKNERARLRNEQYRTVVAKWCEKLSAHFNFDLTEEQIEIFMEGLVKDSDYQIETAFERCLNECTFMPKLREVHEKMPERREASTTTGAYVRTGPPIADLNRPIAEKLCVLLHGRRYATIDCVTEGKLIQDLFRKANFLRYITNGIDISRWMSKEDADELHDLNQKLAKA